MELGGIFVSLVFMRVCLARKAWPLLALWVLLAVGLCWVMAGWWLTPLLLGGLGYYGRVRWAHR
ncbi:MAG: hypothetical protein ACRDRD_23275, partial [Pseudonocardiaceae bacterium]